MVMQFSPRIAITFVDVLFLSNKNSSPEIVEREGLELWMDGWGAGSRLIKAVQNPSRHKSRVCAPFSTMLLNIVE